MIMNWLYHIHASPHCYQKYPGIYDSKGREACPCGWVASTKPQPAPICAVCGGKAEGNCAFADGSGELCDKCDAEERAAEDEE